MRHVALLVGLAAAGCSDSAAPGRADRDRFQGYWRVIAHERAGAAVANEVGGIRFRDDCFILWAADPSRSFDARYSLEPHHSPPRIVFHEDPPWWNEPPANGVDREKIEEEHPPWRERRIVGIYNFDDNGRLILCFIRGSDSPPWRFRSTDHREGVLMVLEKGER